VIQKGTDRRTWLYRLGCWCWSRIYTLYATPPSAWYAHFFCTNVIDPFVLF